MDGLRWLLLLFGLLVIAGVYFYSRREKSSPETKPLSSGRVEPTLGSERSKTEPDTNDVSDDSPGDDVADDQDAPITAENLPQKIVTLRLVARDGGSFRGDELILSLRGIGMRHGKFGIFHRYDGSNEEDTIFSAASLVEPGSFDLTNIKEQELPRAARSASSGNAICARKSFSSSTASRLPEARLSDLRHGRTH
jgi:cell division protein ZipA